MSDSLHNDLLLATMEMVVGDGTDLEPVRSAFEATRGDFAAKFTAAVQARLSRWAVPEVVEHQLGTLLRKAGVLPSREEPNEKRSGGSQS
jgi:hypothetical protein